MGSAIKTIGQCTVKIGVGLPCVLCDFQAFITDFRLMTKHGNSVKPNLSLYNTKVALSLASY